MEIIMVGIGLSLKNGNGMYRKHSSQIHTKVITLLLNNLITSIRCLIPVKDFCRFTVIRLCLPTQYGIKRRCKLFGRRVQIWRQHIFGRSDHPVYKRNQIFAAGKSRFGGAAVSRIGIIRIHCLAGCSKLLPGCIRVSILNCDNGTQSRFSGSCHII